MRGRERAKRGGMGGVSKEGGPGECGKGRKDWGGEARKGVAGRGSWAGCFLWAAGLVTEGGVALFVPVQAAAVRWSKAEASCPSYCYCCCFSYTPAAVVVILRLDVDNRLVFFLYVEKVPLNPIQFPNFNLISFMS